ncbi:EF-hand domain-containing protein [Planctomicrobium piriforme]|uniref:EF hand n=1 Tax=Planctomicrobium piriforme TaxID=1576369 RepID=A0A1I3ILC8_9PLAN|nr:EF-hand domain-containing protein [Planctomicrobium piriforme]SFI48722.1 EF hand [Planctomicrobium piriforme]
MKKLTLSLLTVLSLSAFSSFAMAQADGEKPDLDATFKKMDKDSDGKVTQEEFLGKKEGDKLEKAKTLFSKLDKDSDGKLTLEEFKDRKKK